MALAPRISPKAAPTKAYTVTERLRQELQNVEAKVGLRHASAKKAEAKAASAAAVTSAPEAKATVESALNAATANTIPEPKSENMLRAINHIIGIVKNKNFSDEVARKSIEAIATKSLE